MKSDIIISEVENVFIAAVQEWSDDFMEKVWYAYLVNDSDFNLDGVMIVSKAFGTIDGEMKKTSLLRHAYVEVPAVSVVKIEMLENSVLALNNEFMVTFFIGDKLYDRKFIFRANSITPDNVEEIPILFVDGVIAR
jgi:energy-converting hydrogenase Eha subunit E